MDGVSREDYFSTHKCKAVMFLSEYFMQIAQITMICMSLSGNHYILILIYLLFFQFKKNKHE